MKVLGISKDSIPVYDHPEGHPHRPDLLEETIGKIEINGSSFIRETVDLGRIIGKDHLVETNRDSRIVYRRRGNRNGFSRMVLNQEAADTSKVTIVICKCDASDPEYEGLYVVVTLFEGEPGMREPWDASIQDSPEALAVCAEFWATHALVPEE